MSRELHGPHAPAHGPRPLLCPEEASLGLCADAPRPLLAALALGLLVGLVALPTVAAAGPSSRTKPGPTSAEPTFAEVDALLADPAVPLTDVRLSDGETLPDPEPEPLLVRLGTDLPCGTVLARAAERSLVGMVGPRRDDLEQLLVAPRLASPRELPVAGESLVLSFDAGGGSRHSISRRDADRDQVPDQLAGLTDDLRTASTRIGEALGWNRRFAGGDGTLRVIVAATPFPDGSFLPGGTPQLVVPKQLSGTARLVAVTHQLAHAALHELDADLPASFEEAVATLLAQSVLLEEGETWPAPADLLPERPAERALFSPGILAARGDATFLAWLGRESGLPAAWLSDALLLTTRRLDVERATSRPTRAAARNAVLDSLDELLLGVGSSLPEAVATYQVWALEQELLTRGEHACVTEDLARVPTEIARSGRELPPLGQLRFGIDVPIVGGLAVGFEGDDRAEAVAVALLTDGTVRHFPIDAGHAELPDLKLAAGGLRRIVVLVHAPTPPATWQPWEGDGADDAPGAFSVSATSDPSYPFVLGSISTEVRAGQVTLDWSTSSEEDLVGWVVERASRPAGPFDVVMPIPLPAQSRPGEPAGYAFVDPTVRPSSRYHYRVTAVTSSGLTEVSPVVALRTLPPAMGASGQ